MRARGYKGLRQKQEYVVELSCRPGKRDCRVVAPRKDIPGGKGEDVLRDRC